VAGSFLVLNAFIEDTCVLVAVAFLLARGRILALLFRGHRTAWETLYLGIVLGLIGVTEEAFPGARFPYVTHALIVTFAALAGGPLVSLVTVAVVTLGAIVIGGAPAALGTLLSVLPGALVGEALRRAARGHLRLPVGFAAGVLAQSAGVLVQMLPHGIGAGSLVRSFSTVPANGFGVALLMLVVHDAQLRADSERHRVEAERALNLVTEAQLSALRARVHPHFLFNALTSIAALCTEAPEKAEAATVRLGQLMRRVLETNAATPLCLGDEIAHVRGYLEMEQMRLGERLRASWQVDDGCAQLRVPPFAIQTLVENAVRHGIAPRVGPGEITVAVRRSLRHTLIAVTDTGMGMTAETRREALDTATQRLHGLRILTQQLTLLYGERSRVRLFSQVELGTVAAFAVPAEAALLGRKAG
jgi:LytS/YehU family sensor histidine kinase